MNEIAVEGKVAQILNERELVINRGSKDGVKRGMKFAVLAAESTDVVDPDSQEVLGRIDGVKVRVEARTVQERFSICATYEKTVVGGSVFDIVGTPRREVVASLKASAGSYLEPLPEADSYVKVGDRMRQIDS